MDFELVIDSIPKLLEGALLTIEITALSVVIGLAFSLPLALMRVSRKPALWMPVYAYIFYSVARRCWCRSS